MLSVTVLFAENDPGGIGHDDNIHAQLNPHYLSIDMDQAKNNLFATMATVAETGNSLSLCRLQCPLFAYEHY